MQYCFSIRLGSHQSCVHRHPYFIETWLKMYAYARGPASLNEKGTEAARQTKNICKDFQVA